MSEDTKEQLFRLIGTYKISRWFAVPKQLSPSVCASKGWSNTALYTLHCSKCKECLKLDFPSIAYGPERERKIKNFLKNLSEGHLESCHWRSNEIPYHQYDPIKMPVSEMVSDIIVRFSNINCLWDLPELLETDSNLENLYNDSRNFSLKDLHKKFLKDKMPFLDVEKIKKASDGRNGTVSEDVWNKRIKTLFLLSIFGWDICVLDHFVTSKKPTRSENSVNHQRYPSLFISPTHSDEGCKKCIISKQSVLMCKYCNIKYGMWNYETDKTIHKTEFSEYLKTYHCKASKDNINLPCLTKIEKGESSPITNDKWYFGEIGKITNIIKDENPIAKSQDIVKNEQNNVVIESISELISKRKAFGFGAFKKRKFSETNDSNKERDSRGESVSATLDVNNEKYMNYTSHKKLKATVEEDNTYEVFDPVEKHRSFCPYRRQWRDIIEKLIK